MAAYPEMDDAFRALADPSRRQLLDSLNGRNGHGRVEALADLKLALEEAPMDKPSFVYTTYIRTTPEQLWQALTDPAFTLRYWGIGMQSDWKPGSPILLQWGPGQDFRDIEQIVLQSDPFRRLSYRWHNYQREHAEMFGWSDERFAELVKEPRSKVTFELEPFGGA